MKKYYKLLLVLSVTIFITSCSYLGPLSSKSSNLLEIHSIDVGQGDSTLIVSPDGHSMLIDAGEDEYSRNVIRHIKRSKVKCLDYLVGTHFDSDHIGGVDKVAKEIPTKQIFLTDDKGSNKDLIEIINISKEKNIPLSPLKSGQTIKLGRDISYYVLAPLSKKEDSNDNSLVILLKYLNHYSIFTGDAGSNIESEILSHYTLPRVDLLKVGHHGSKNSSCDQFLSNLSPKIAVISCGYGNSYGHPHQDTLDRLHKVNSKIYRTDLNGDMVFYFDGSKIYTKNRYKFQ